MEGKLIKQEKRYYALYNNEGVFISDINGGSIANKLSIKNCEAVFNGYDLDELAKYFAYNQSNEDSQEEFAKFAFIEGFQKALELLGDKKFSEEEFKLFARQYYREIKLDKSNLLWSQLADKCLEEHIQSKQQNEWDVTYNPNEKDSDGCLILKRK